MSDDKLPTDPCGNCGHRRELRRAAAEGRSKTERFRIALAAVAACMVMQ